MKFTIATHFTVEAATIQDAAQAMADTLAEAVSHASEDSDRVMQMQYQGLVIVGAPSLKQGNVVSLVATDGVLVRDHVG